MIILATIDSTIAVISTMLLTFNPEVSMGYITIIVTCRGYQ